MKEITKNKKAFFDYTILEKFEAGIVLEGSEVKSIRNNQVNLKNSFCKIINSEIFVFDMHISKYSQQNSFKLLSETRARKLLLKKKEILKLYKKVNEEGLSIVPLRIYFNDKNKCKIEIALVKGKKLYDKRETLKKKTQDMDIKRSLKDY